MPLAKLALMTAWLTFAGAAFSQSPPQDATCLMCGRVHAESDFVVFYKGKGFPLCSDDCRDHWLDAERTGTLDEITKSIEPRAALFQSDSMRNPPLHTALMIIGLYVLSGLLLGGIASYLAVQKGYHGRRAFFLSLGLSVVGFAIAFLQPRQASLFRSEGLRKVPLTHSETRCPECGAANHPSAESCSSCGAPLVPTADSEVRIARTGD